MWPIKIIAKIILSRIPLAYWVWRRLGVFRHGNMHQAEYAVRVVTTHVERLGGVERVRGAVCLELGPGDSLASAVIAHAFGAKRTYLVDVGNFANPDVETYRKLAKELERLGFPVPDLSHISDVREMLRLLNAEYLTEGLHSLRSIGASSVDMVWSQAVLEHIRLDEVRPLFRELNRILMADGAMSHRIDFKDHLGGSLNNLRFSRSLWETEAIAKSGFYTNRLRSIEMMESMKAGGFDLVWIKPSKWEKLPVPQGRLHPEFRGLSQEDLLTREVDLLARPISRQIPTELNRENMRV